MFFFVIFGTNEKEKVIKTNENIICPLCGAYGRYDVVKIYTYFHFYFIPLFRWNIRYHIRTHCCAKMCEISKSAGKNIESSVAKQVKQEDILFNFTIKNCICQYCHSQINNAFTYCPHCGKKL